MDPINATRFGSVAVADLVGKKLKDFYVLRRLGRGAMAEVYLAQQQSLGRQVALKVGLGEADAAVVYASDVTPTLKKTVRVVPLPTRFNQTAAYPLGVVRGSVSADAARAFVAFVKGREGQAILRRWGFLSP